jgi:hypothetical protein
MNLKLLIMKLLLVLLAYLCINFFSASEKAAEVSAKFETHQQHFELDSPINLFIIN